MKSRSLIIIVTLCTVLALYYLFYSRNINTEISGNVTGLSGTELSLGMTSEQRIWGKSYKKYTISNNGKFSYPVTIGMHNLYELTITNQPSSPNQTCTPSNIKGIYTGKPITNIVITCSPWTRYFGTNENDSDTVGKSVATDFKGNTYVTGYTAKFQEIRSHYSDKKEFLIAYDADGNILFNKTMAIDNTTTIAHSIAVDTNNNIYVVGETGGEMYDANKVYNDYKGSYFLAKYNSKGDNIFTIVKKNFGVESVAKSVITDSFGYVYIIGDVYNFDDSHNEKIISFITKYDSKGNEIFTNTLDSDFPQTSAISVSLDQQGNIYMAGTTNQDLGDDQLERPVGINSNSFLVKYNKFGKELYKKEINCNDNNVCQDTLVLADKHGNAYLIGAGFGEITYQENTVNLFVIKYDRSGKEVYKKQFQDDNDEEAHAYPHSSVLDSHGNLIIVGHTNRPLFGHKKTGDCDLFLIKIDPKGVILYTQLKGAFDGNTVARSVATDSDDNLFITGEMSDPSSDFPYNQAERAMFLIKYDENGNIL